jgi:dimethylargininase
MGNLMPKPNNVFHFNQAIVRRPSRSITQGLRAVDRGAPTYEDVVMVHDRYQDALQRAGVQVHVLEALEAFPDSMFVEDPALVFPEGAIVLAPGAVSRAGESAEMAPTLNHLFERVLTLGAGQVEGGDILTTPDAVMIGLSDRTTQEGAAALQDCLAEFGRKGVIVETPPGVLHFKTDCSLLDEQTVLCTERLAASGVFKGLNTIHVAPGEDAAANALRINDVVLLGEEYNKTRTVLEANNYKVLPLPTEPISRVDAGLSCMSLRWFG